MAPERRPTRVAFVIGSAEVGGAEQLVLTLIRSLPAGEFECAVVCPAGPLVDEYARAGAHVETLGATRGRDFLSPAFIVALAARFRRWRTDVVHTSLYLSDAGGLVAARLARVPRIVSHIVGHNFDLSTDRGLRRLRRAVWGRLYRGIYVLADRIIAVSSAVARDLVERPGIRVPAAKISVVHHTLPPDHPRPPAIDPAAVRASLGFDADAVLIATVASLFPVKGHHVLLEALETAVRRMPSLRAVFVGDGPAREALELLAVRLGIGSFVRFAGVMTDLERDAVVAASRIIVLPSLSEGLPVTLLEAMAAGKPVVASDVGGVPELVVNGETGVLVPPGDPAALADAIVALASDDARGERLAGAARTRLEQEFSREAMVDQLRNIYAGRSTRAEGAATA